MIKLLTYAEAFGQFSASPFCLKATWLLNMSDLPWERVDMNDPRSMPHQKLPAIRDGDTLVADSDNIRQHLEARGADFEPNLSDIDKATARAFIRMAEEHMYFHQVMDRWGKDENWVIIRELFFGQIPKPLRGFISGGIRKSARKGLHQQGIGRLTEEERMARIEPDLNAITTRLWQGQFLFGDTPTAADASVGAILACMQSSPTPTVLSRRIATDPVLSDYVDRATATMGNDWVSSASA